MSSSSLVYSLSMSVFSWSGFSKKLFLDFNHNAKYVTISVYHMLHIMKLQSFPFYKIKEGKKNIEVRLYDEKRREIKIGDIIEFKREPEQVESVKAEVIALLNYKTFTDLAYDFPASDFGHSNTEDLLKSIYTFYTQEQEEKYTVLGIKIKLV